MEKKPKKFNYSNGSDSPTTPCDQVHYDAKQLDTLDKEEPSSLQESSRAKKYTVLTEINRLTSGSAFGELALSGANNVRQASIKCMTPCIFAVIEKRDFKRCLNKIEDKKTEEKIKWLRSTPFYGKWSRTQITKHLLNIIPIVVHKDKVLMKEGEKTSHIYLIREGEFELIKRVRKPTIKQSEDSSDINMNFMVEEK